MDVMCGKKEENISNIRECKSQFTCFANSAPVRWIATNVNGVLSTGTRWNSFQFFEGFQIWPSPNLACDKMRFCSATQVLRYEYTIGLDRGQIVVAATLDIDCDIQCF